MRITVVETAARPLDFRRRLSRRGVEYEYQTRTCPAIESAFPDLTYAFESLSSSYSRNNNDVDISIPSYCIERTGVSIPVIRRVA